MIVHRVYEHQRWSTFAREWSSDNLAKQEPAFVESHEGGASAINFAEMCAILDAEVPRSHVVDTPWSFSTTGNVDKEGWCYTGGDIHATDWVRGDFTSSSTRR